MIADFPLADLRVLVTRQVEASNAFAARLIDLGATPIVRPAIEIMYRSPPGLDLALKDLNRFDWLVLTSANSVRALVSRCDSLKLDLGVEFNKVNIAVVGSATESAVSDAGGAAAIASKAGDGVGLAEDLIAAGVVRSLVLFPASRIAGPELSRRLRENGAAVIQLAVYDTVAPYGLTIPEPSMLDVATFTSPSAVRNVAAVVDRDWFETVPVVCIGKTTAGAAREAGALSPLIARESSVAGLVDVLLDFRTSRQQEAEYHGAI